MKFSPSIIVLLASISMLTGCITANDINKNFRDLDNAWLIENQKHAEKQLTLKVDAPYEITFNAVKKTFNDLNMSITKLAFDKGYILSRNEAPNPLNEEQWEEVRRIENPKLSNISWMLTIPEEPEGQFVTIKALIEKSDNKSDVTLSYYLEFPEYEDMGLIPSKEAPPHAVKLMSEMFWDKLNQNILITRQQTKVYEQ